MSWTVYGLIYIYIYIDPINYHCYPFKELPCITVVSCQYKDAREIQLNNIKLNGTYQNDILEFGLNHNTQWFVYCLAECCSTYSVIWWMPFCRVTICWMSWYRYVIPKCVFQTPVHLEMEPAPASAQCPAKPTTFSVLVSVLQYFLSALLSCGPNKLECILRQSWRSLQGTHNLCGPNKP
jgi:hypothetical protein